jgi:hypothetical protein
MGPEGVGPRVLLGLLLFAFFCLRKCVVSDMNRVERGRNVRTIYKHINL